MKCPRCNRFFQEGFKFCPYDGAEVQERVSLSAYRSESTKTGDTILADRYRVRGFIGKGAMARVYLAEDANTGAAVAIKVLEDPYRKDANVRARFMREARSASLIGHPSIVRVFETGEREEDGAPFLVMEFLLGESVGAFLRREGKMKPELALPAFRQAASALSAAHRVGIIHRDIKPDNLFLIGEPGDPYELKVVDFGLSREPTSNLTAAGIVLGTPAYMAPEQVATEPVDARTDVYALGMVMYRALAGRGPFEDDDEVATMAHQIFTAPPPPSKFVRDLDPWLEAVLLRAMRKDPNERYPKMDALVDDLNLVGSGRPPRAPSVLAPEKPFIASTVLGGLIAKSIGRTIGRDP